MEKEYSNELSNNYDETSLDLDIQYEDFKGIMTVFVSHKFVKTDQNLALILQNKLKEHKISGHLAERKKPYDSLVRDKIMKSIQNSDYLIAIITKEASRSASLNQEIGYALGSKVPVIIMRERNADHGVLTYGLQDEEFTRENFERPCENVIGYIIQNGSRNKISRTTEYDVILDKFTEGGNHYVGIRNAKGKTIKSCTVFCDFQKCSWWDTHESFPRNIAEGEGANVILPLGFANTNPFIKILSGEEEIEQLRLSGIVRRPSSKWNAEDENEERVERLNAALGRIRSNLASLYGLFQIFLGYTRTIPITDDVRMDINHKNELVENTQTVVNQTSHMLEMDWINSLNDLCSLAKKNPWFLGEKLQLMNCDSCVGIKSQIDNLLVRLPNPPI